MLILGIETSCDETGLALYDAGAAKLLAHRVHSQVAMHEVYGGVVPELASRDHIRRLVPLSRQVLEAADCKVSDIGAVAYTEGPGLAGALLAGAAFARSLAQALGIPALGIHHLEGHLLSPLLSVPPPQFPFVALLVSGGHTQLMRVQRVGVYELLGETQDDAAGEAFDKTAQLLGLGYPGGPALSKLAESGNAKRCKLPRPMIASGNLEFSFSGLKTAVHTLLRNEPAISQADLARGFVDAVVEVLVAKCALAMRQTGLAQVVVAGGVGANTQLRAALDVKAALSGFEVFYPEPELCTDNGAMIAFAAALRLQAGATVPAHQHAFTVRPRWDLASIS
ncbi:MAG: tRNA (adenosine(37)-N6)-threonylcarbamoyltransferase complex transferase subunit TsaD [Candidatus Parcubacteria bacterium]|nr:tRNA (adenosine(37)-N6)-threonylcarbamoyltransferase complex transferase subunit TsaD [Burkholderiales bacterium]